MNSSTVAVIGGSVIGLSTAYQLALKRVGRVVLLEKGRLGEGASSRAAGIGTHLLWSEPGVRARQIGFQLFRRFSAEWDDYTFHDERGCLNLFTPQAWPTREPLLPLYDRLQIPYEVLDAREVPYAVVELNPANARSIASCGKRVICGDARNAEILRSAGIEHAKILALTMPDERAVIEVLHAARRLNPTVKMLARCNYTSTGMKAEKAGASAVLVEEQLVALEFAKLMSNTL